MSGTAVLTETFHNSPQFLQQNVDMLPSIRLRPPRCTFLQLITNHLCYIAEGIDQ
jgi:hypothetical protein